MVVNNLELLFNLGFKALEDIFYTYAVAFLQDEQKFKTKVFRLCEKAGKNYVAVLESNLDLWEGIL